MEQLYLGWLRSASAEARMEGIGRWAAHGGAAAELSPLLRDDVPVVRVHGGRRLLTEVRMAALVALQDQYRQAGLRWDLGPVTVRPAMPADDAVRDAEARLAALPADRRAALDAEVARELAPDSALSAADRAAVHAYRVLQRLGAVAYEQQEVDPQTWLTPIQVAVHASQTVSERPRPHVRFSGADGPVGWLYRRDGVWVLDFDESPAGRELRELVAQWQSAVRGGVPNVVHDAAGRPVVSADGSFVLDGVVAADTDRPVDYLRSVAAFVGRRRPCVLVTD